MSDRRAEELIQVILDRPDICHVLQSETFDRDDITSHLGVSRSTTHRIVRKLRESGVIERLNSEYRLTVLGAILTSEVDRTIQRIDDALAVHPLLEAADELDVAVDISLFTEATVMTSEGGDVSKIENHLVEMVEGASVVRNASESIISYRYLSTLCDRMNDDASVEIVSTQDAFTFISTTHPGGPALYDDEDVTCYIQDEIPLTVVIADDQAVVCVSNDTLPRLDMLVTVDDPDAVEWVDSVYQSIRATATTYTPDSTGD